MRRKSKSWYIYLLNIESYCNSIESACNKYNRGSPVWTEFLDKKYKLLKECSSKNYDEIWKIEDLNEPYFAEKKLGLQECSELSAH